MGDVYDLQATLDRMVNEQFETPEFERFLSVPLTMERARFFVLQNALYTKNRRDCWGYVQGSAPLDVKALVWKHESDELINDPRCNTDHFSLCVKQGEVLGLTPEDFETAQLPPMVRACFYAWIHIATRNHWLTAFTSSQMLERRNNGQIVKGGGLSLRVGKKFEKELGIELKNRAMQFIPLTPICSGCLKWAATDESLTEYRLQGHSLLHQPVEQQSARPGGAAVETKGEFVEVIVQMIWAYRALVSAEQPPLEQGSNSIDPRQQILSQLIGGSNHLVFVAQGLQSAIARPAIGLDAGAWLDGLLDSRLQTPSRRVRDAGQANPPDLATICLGRNQYQTLASGPAPALARLWPADEGLIDLHHPGQTISARSHHCPA